MEAEIAQQNKIQASIRQETYLLKKSANELKDQIANLSIALRELQAEERQLSKEVVHSPDRIKLDLAEAMQRLEKVKNGIVERQRERTMAQKRVENTASAEESLKQIITMLDEMSRKVQEYEFAKKDSEELQDKLQGLKHDVERRKEAKESQERQLEAIGTSLS